MRENKSKNKCLVFLAKKVKKLNLFDSIIFFMIIMGHYDFGFIQCLTIIVYVVYKILNSSNNSNFYNKVAFS